jgi:hypothetical protein
MDLIHNIIIIGIKDLIQQVSKVSYSSWCLMDITTWKIFVYSSYYLG